MNHESLVESWPAKIIQGVEYGKGIALKYKQKRQEEVSETPDDTEGKSQDKPAKVAKY